MTSSWREGRTTADRGYGEAWRRARLLYLRAHPWCAMCAQMGHLRVAAGVVDHIQPHKGDATLFWDQSNWQSLCRTCHDTRKAQLERGGKMRGHTEDGRPIDPNHHWNT